MRDQNDHRAPVWLAISEFYLDTELQEDDLERLALVFAQSPYDLDELRAIERFEVAPVLWGNLIDVAGEWEPWDPNTLIPLCAHKENLGRGWTRRIATSVVSFFLAFHTRRSWNLIEPRILRLRAAA